MSRAAETPPEHPVSLQARGLSVGYGARAVLAALDLTVDPSGFTVIVGPNACGKSTLLRTLARLLQPTAGAVLLDGSDIHRMPTRQVARRIGLLPQSSQSPEGIRVVDLVSRGRYPHQGLLSRWTARDEAAIREAMAATGVSELAHRPVDELSGGQRQRVWVALALAQQTPLLLLDEPTTFLDIAHQVELLELFAELHESGRTLVAVLHDLNQAARYATRLVAMKDGRIVAAGAPHEVVTEELVREVFGLPARVIPDPETGSPLVVPLRRTGHLK